MTPCTALPLLVLLVSSPQAPAPETTHALGHLRPLRGTWPAGETPRLDLQIVNPGDHVLRVPLCRTLIRLEVDGLEFRPRGPSAAPYVGRLRPGETTHPMAIPLEGFRFEGEGKERRLRALRLEPGPHTVRITFRVDSLTGGFTETVATQPVEVEVLPEGPEGVEVGSSDAELQQRRRLALGARLPKPRFGIYLVDTPVESPRVDDLDVGQVSLGDVPLFSESDVVSYDWSTHTIVLKPESLERLPSPGVWGLPFVVVVDGERVYLGAFWTHLSSYLPKLPVCYADMGILALDPEFPKGAIRIEAPPVEGRADPRGDARVRKVLEATGKLKK